MNNHRDDYRGFTILAHTGIAEDGSWSAPYTAYEFGLGNSKLNYIRGTAQGSYSTIGDAIRAATTECKKHIDKLVASRTIVEQPSRFSSAASAPNPPLGHGNALLRCWEGY